MKIRTYLVTLFIFLGLSGAALAAGPEPDPWWKQVEQTQGLLVKVTYQGQTVIAILGDTMPSLENIHNGAGMDTNPAVAKAFGLKAPYMVPMTWQRA